MVLASGKPGGGRQAEIFEVGFVEMSGNAKAIHIDASRASVGFHPAAIRVRKFQVANRVAAATRGSLTDRITDVLQMVKY